MFGLPAHCRVLSSHAFGLMMIPPLLLGAQDLGNVLTWQRSMGQVLKNNESADVSCDFALLADFPLAFRHWNPLR